MIFLLPLMNFTQIAQGLFVFLLQIKSEIEQILKLHFQSLSFRSISRRQPSLNWALQTQDISRLAPWLQKLKNIFVSSFFSFSLLESESYKPLIVA